MFNLMDWIFSVQANSLHFAVERSSGAICLGGFVSLSTIANRSVVDVLINHFRKVLLSSLE